MRIYIGAYTTGDGEGIYRAELHPDSGRLELTGVVRGVANPSFLVPHPKANVLYAVNEDQATDGQPGGAVSAFAVDPATGDLRFLNRQPSGGEDPCHLTLDAAGRCLLATNYSGGSVAVFTLGTDGALAPRSCLVRHTGSGPDPDRQEAPHPHSVNLSPDNRFACVADLGIDRLVVYRLDTATGTLTACPEQNGSMAPGSGPRHLTFDPTGRWAYVINELGSSITQLAYESPTGALTPRGTVATLPAACSCANTAAEVRRHPSGRWLYGSNRGHDSIAVFAVAPDDGSLTPLGHTPTQGSDPRHFDIDPAGRHLVVANQTSGTVVSFRIDPHNGKLEPTGHVLQIPDPVCVLCEIHRRLRTGRTTP